MLIRSQNKEVLAVLESMFDVEASGGMICARKHNGWVCLLGKYSTQSKALKVLDMVQRRWCVKRNMGSYVANILHRRLHFGYRN